MAESIRSRKQTAWEGVLIGRYQIEQRLSVGGMGAVYRALDKRLVRPVALKQILPKALEDEHALSRFRREARSLAKLSHPNIVKIHDVLEVKGCDWIVMELVEGKTLGHLLTTRPLPLEQRLHIAAGIADALTAIHNEGIVHRDLKARNVLMNATMQPKLADFGLAKHMQYRPSESASISRIGQILGTPPAMSPEQVMGRKIDQRSDLFSFGSLLYEITTGVPPFHSEDPLETLAKIWTHQPPSVRQHESSLPRGLADLIDILLEKDPTHRPESATEVAATLRRIIADLANGAGSNPLKRKRAELPDRETAELTTPGPIGELRQVTVLCCDLTTQNPSTQPEVGAHYDDIIAFGQRVRELTSAFKGHIANDLEHRKIIYFGFPKSLGHTTESAIEAALELADVFKDSTSRIATRIGVHTCTALVLTTVDQHQAILGDDLDVAIALPKHAAPNEVLVSDTVCKLLDDRSQMVECEPLSESSQATTVFRVRRTQTCRARQMHLELPPLVGRQEELDFLLSRWRLTDQGNGQTALLCGEAGIGKSRLLNELGNKLLAQGVSWHKTTTSRGTESSPFQPIVDLTCQLLRIERRQSPGQQIDHLENILESLALKESAPILSDFLGLGSDERQPASAKTQRARLLESLLSLYLQSAAQTPVVLAVEDLHWADPSTLELLGKLTERLDSSHLFLLMTFRPEFSPTWPELGNLNKLYLDRLPNTSSIQLITQVADGRELPIEVRELIVEKTDGVPLFVEELTKALLESGSLLKERNSYKLVDSIDDLSVPLTLRDSLSLRLDRLGEAKQTARLAATIGRQFTYPLLTAVSQLPETEVRSHLDLLLAAEIVQRKGFSTSKRYYFKHALIQDAAYGSLLKRQRETYHARIAQIYEHQFKTTAGKRPDLIGHHWAMSGLKGRAIPYLSQAGDRSRASYANEEATIFYQRALRLLEEVENPQSLPNSDRTSLHLNENLGELMTIARRWEEARSISQAALKHARTPRQKARLNRKIACTYEHSGRQSLTQLEVAEKSLPIKPYTNNQYPREDWHEWLEIQYKKLLAYHRIGDLKSMKSLSDYLDPLMTAHGTLELQCGFLEIKVAIQSRLEGSAPSAQTIDAARQYLRACQRLGEKARLADAWSTMGVILLLANENERSEKALSKGLELSCQSQDITVEAVCRAYLSLAHRKANRIPEVKQLSHEILRSNTRTEYLGLAEGNFAWLANKEGRLQAATEHGFAALRHWEGSSFSFQWTALFPTLSALLELDRTQEAITISRQLLLPSQQQLFEPLENLIHDGISMWESQEEHESKQTLFQATKLAKEHAYL